MLTEAERKKIRNDNPHMEARFATVFYNISFDDEEKGPMDFWDSLSPEAKEISNTKLQWILEGNNERITQ